MTQLTEHFTLQEFACHDGTPYPAYTIDEEDPARRTWLESRLLPLAETLEVIRGALEGRALYIDSGYRTLAYDGAIYKRSLAQGGGANDKAPPATSQHPKGRAADIRTGSLTAAQLRDLIGGLYRAGKLPHLGALGVYPSFVHIDVRARPGSTGGACDGHLAQWGGSRLTNIA
ncbi:MAG: hypothetical protein ABI445_24245 [Polyangia bacterium]